jgi:GDP-L-fucose synthase
VRLTDKRICITGGGGFLGSHLVEILRERGCEQIFIPRRRDSDLTTAEGVQGMFEKARPQVLFHLAAVVGGIGANRENPGRFFYENAIMGIQVIEYARRHGVEKTIVAGTICAYPKFTPVPFREEDLWNGYPEETNAPYGVAKKALLVQCQAYREQYGLNCIYLLPVNLYGPRDNFDLQSSHVIPALIRKFIEARRAGAPEVICWGDGTPTREFLFVRDAAQGLALAAERYDLPEPVNLGSGEEISICALAEMIGRECGYQGRIAWDPSKPNGQPRRCLDTTRAWEYFGFRARAPLLDGIRETIRWYEGEGK